MTQSIKWQTASNMAKTLYLPVQKAGQKIVEYKIITAIAVLAIIILVICAKYVKTQAMDNFNQGLSHAYKVTADFLRNKTNAILIGCIGGVVYLFIGQALLNKEITKATYDDGYTRGDKAGYTKGRKAGYAKGEKAGFNRGTKAPFIPNQSDNTVSIRVKIGEGQYQRYKINVDTCATVLLDT